MSDGSCDTARCPMMWAAGIFPCNPRIREPGHLEVGVPAEQPVESFDTFKGLIVFLPLEKSVDRNHVEQRVVRVRGAEIIDRRQVLALVRDLSRSESQDEHRFVPLQAGGKPLISLQHLAVFSCRARFV